MVLARNTLKEACAMDVPEVEISSDLQKLYNLNVTKKVLDLIGLEMSSQALRTAISSKQRARFDNSCRIGGRC